MEQRTVLRVAARCAKLTAQFCVDSLAIVTTRANHHAEHVLLVRVDAIGDFVLWIDAAKATVKNYKAQGKSVLLIANKVWATWAEDLSIFDEVIPFDRKAFESNLIYRFHFGRRMRRTGCSIAVQPTYSREWLFGDALIRMSGAPERIGSQGGTQNVRPWQKRISDRWYTRLIAADPAHLMELIRNAEFVRGLLDGNFRAKVADLRGLTANRLDPAFTAAIPATQPYFVLVPGASWDGKEWSIENFIQVAEWLHDMTGWHGVVCGGDADRNLAEEACRRSSIPLLNWAGRTDLSQLSAILSDCRLLVTNDTSSAHIAAAVGAPTVCVLGGGHYGRFMPYEVEQTDERPLPTAVVHHMPCFNCNWRCIYPRTEGKPVPCIDRVTVSQVILAISQLLELNH